MRQLIYVFFFLSASLFAQQQRTIDSIKLITQEEKRHDTIITDSYDYLLRYYKRNNVDSCLVYFQRLKAYSDKNESDLG
ncbi:MAG: hypothetical protein KUG68_06025, partial [Flavobacteriaceae bacterium]|nr:hypothetical protein [Flavobacteriaceae bacterium]